MVAGVVIIGGGQAGVQAADSLRALDPDVHITIIADEASPPYQRPPLSKSLWCDDIGEKAVPLRGAAFFDDHNIELRLGVRADFIDRLAKRVQLSDGRSLPYAALVIATGARARTIPLPGLDLPGVHGLRTRENALALQAGLRRAKSLMVIGGGFLGLEVAASAAQNGVKATVLEVQDRILARAVTPTTSRWLTDYHRRAGVDIRLSNPLRALVPGQDNGTVTAIGADHSRVEAELAVVGIGVTPNTELAEVAGLPVEDGVLVDAHLRTADLAIWAIGDCARFPSHQTARHTRLESVQNATDQARTVAKNVFAAQRGTAPEAYIADPWFWSHQGDARLQIAGIGDTGRAGAVVRAHGGAKITVLAHESGRLIVAESVNAPADHVAARRIIAAGGYFDPVAAQDPAVPLASVVRNARARSKEEV